MRHQQRAAINFIFRFAKPKITRTEEGHEMRPQIEGVDAVFVDLQGFIIQRRNEILPGLRDFHENRKRFRQSLRALKYEFLEIIRRKGSRAVKNGALHVFGKRNRTSFKSIHESLVTLVEFSHVQAKVFDSLMARGAVPAVR